MHYLGNPKLRQKAERLVEVAHLVAVSSNSGLLDKLPEVNRFLTTHGGEGVRALDLYFTVACTGIGLTTANVQKEEADAFLIHTMAVLQKFDERAPRLLGEFLQEAVIGLNNPSQALKPVGFWILRQLGLPDSSCISKDEISAFGGMALTSMSAWD